MKKGELCSLTHYQTTNFRLFWTERVCRRQFKIWRKWQKVIQTGRKDEIACYKQFLLVPQCFQKACFPRASKGVIVWEWVNPFPHNDTCWRPWETSLLKTLWEKAKLLITSNFSFSHIIFYPFGLTFCHFCQIWNCGLQTLSVWKSLKFVVW